jgi:hypothetical protein
MREAMLGPAHPDVAVSLNDLGNFYFTHGRLSEAELLYQQALEIMEKASKSI